MRESTRRRFAAVLVLIMAGALTACNGSGGNSGASAPSLVPPVSSTFENPGPDVLGPIGIYPGEVVGRDDKFNPKDGDMTNGGHGNKVGNVPCDPVEHINQYHVHAYLGLIVNGKQVAIPDAIGMTGPGPEVQGYISKAKCYYYIHTHDASGLIHIEDPRNFAFSTSQYTMSTPLAIWGISYGPNNFGSFTGAVHVFVGNVPLKTTQVTKYSAWTKGLAKVPLYSHTAVWVEIGSPVLTAKQLPSVTFYTEY